MTWLVVGASAGLGRSLSEALARDGRSLLLVASDARDLDALSADLRLRYGAEVRGLACDASTSRAPEKIAQALDGQPIDGLLFPIGAAEQADDGHLSGDAVDGIVRTNLTSVISIVGRLLARMQGQRTGVIVGFGSVAAARGRSRNVVYAASKRALESYFESLRHACEPHGIAVALYVVGFMDTNQAFGRRLLLRPAQPTRLAAQICGELGRRRGKHYLPRWWWLVTHVLSALPGPVFRRMRF